MADQYIDNFTATWNNVLTTFHGVKLNVTDTNSSASSRLFTFQIGGTDKIYALKTGALVSASTLTGTGLVLSSGGTINFASSNVVLTHSSAVLTVSTGDLRVTTAGTNSASVVTVAGTQTLLNKTIDGGVSTTAGAVGSYMFANPDSGASATYEPGDTLAGSSLEASGINRVGQTNDTEDALSGTWQCMGYSARGALGADIYNTLWVRTV
jgi:hypothetical protein